MPLPAPALEFYGFQQRVNAATRAEVARLWRRMGDDFDGSWRRLGAPILAQLVEAQSQVATEATNYVPAAVAAVGLADRPSGDFVPSSLVGMASDGRALDTLAYGSVTAAKQAIAGGASAQDALETGGRFLDLMTALQVADTARVAVGSMFTARKSVAGHVRVLNPPSCPRCAILAGRFYRWSTGFQRHPRCDCGMAAVPSEAYAHAEGFIQSPMDAYRKGEIHGLTEAQVKALDDGADISKVVNAYRGVSTTATRSRTVVKSTRDAHVVKLGSPDLLAFIPKEVRLKNTKVAQNYPTPEGIYLEAEGDRDKAISLLKEFGYLK